MTTTKLSWNNHISDRKSITMSDFTNQCYQSDSVWVNNRFI